MLTADCYYLIFYHVEANDLLSLSLVSRMINSISSKDSLWKHHLNKWKYWNKRPTSNFKAVYLDRIKTDKKLLQSLNNCCSEVTNRIKTMNNIISFDNDSRDLLNEIIYNSVSAANLSLKYLATRVLNSLQRHQVLNQLKRLSDAIEVGHGACLISNFYFRFDVNSVLTQFDILASEFMLYSSDSTSSAPLEMAKLLVYFLKLKGFHGNDDYYSPSNSFINIVMETKRGIPITLAIVFASVAFRVPELKQYVHLIGFPRHFLARVYDSNTNQEIFIDMFNCRCLTKDQCLQMATEMGIQVQEEYFRSISNQEVYLRIIRNLLAATHQYEAGFSSSSLIYGVLAQMVVIDSVDNHTVKRLFCHLLAENFPEDYSFITEYCMPQSSEGNIEQYQKYLDSILTKDSDQYRLRVKPRNNDGSVGENSCIRYHIGDILKVSGTELNVVVYDCDVWDNQESSERIPFYKCISLVKSKEYLNDSMFTADQAEVREYRQDTLMKSNTNSFSLEEVEEFSDAGGLGAYFDTYDAVKHEFVLNKVYHKIYPNK